LQRPSRRRRSHLPLNYATRITACPRRVGYCSVQKDSFCTLTGKHRRLAGGYH
jgi:hypothetical protein